MRLSKWVIGLALVVAAPVAAQPIIIPLSPQPQREPPPPPPASSVPVAPSDAQAGSQPEASRSTPASDTGEVQAPAPTTANR